MFRVAKNLDLPASAPTDTFAFFGTRGTGKTYAAGKMIETFVDGGVQVVVVDPVGVHYGLRLAADGRGRGLEIPVFGGIHGDVPLEPTGGELVARIVVEQRVSVVLDVSMFTLSQQHRFVLAFTSALFFLKKSSRTPIHVVFDEAHEFVPQIPGPSEAEMLGAVRRLWKMGRNFGIGVSLISPRPAEVNKGVVDLTERMFCGRLKGPRDRKALESWAASQDADTEAIDDLPRLPQGELLFWTDKGAERIHFLPKRTFDASKTPEAGDARPTATLPKIDLDAVREAMAATIEEAKANDPKVLRAEIARLKSSGTTAALEREITQLRAALEQAKTKTKERVVEKPVFREGDLARVEAIAEKLRKVAEAAGTAAMSLVTLAKPVAAYRAPSAAPTLWMPPAPRSSPPPRAVASGAEGDGTATLGKCPRALLGVIVQRGVATSTQVSILSGYSSTSSGFANGLGELRSKGLVTGGRDRIVPTAEGIALAGHVEPLPVGRALLDYWLGKLGKCERELLRVIYESRSVDRATLSEVSGYSESSSGFANGIGKLRTLELVTGSRGSDITISDVFTEGV